MRTVLVLSGDRNVSRYHKPVQRMPGHVACLLLLGREEHPCVGAFDNGTVSHCCEKAAVFWLIPEFAAHVLAGTLLW